MLAVTIVVSVVAGLFVGTVVAVWTWRWASKIIPGEEPIAAALWPISLPVLLGLWVTRRRREPIPAAKVKS